MSLVGVEIPESAGLWWNAPAAEREWTEEALLRHVAEWRPSSRRTTANFANRYQRDAGLHLSAEDYLRAEGVAFVARNVLAAQSVEAAAWRDDGSLDAAVAAARSIAADGAPRGDPAEFERLTAAAAAEWPNGGGPAVEALAEWFRRAGAEPGRAMVRLAAQLGWLRTS